MGKREEELQISFIPLFIMRNESLWLHLLLGDSDTEFLPLAELSSDQRQRASAKRDARPLD